MFFYFMCYLGTGRQSILVGYESALKKIVGLYLNCKLLKVTFKQQNKNIHNLVISHYAIEKRLENSSEKSIFIEHLMI